MSDSEQLIVRTICEPASPNRLVCDTTLREMPDGSWVLVMLGGGEAEPLAANRIFMLRSLDRGVKWTEPEQLSLGLPETLAQTPSAFFWHQGRWTLVVSTHTGTFADWRTWLTYSDDDCHSWSAPEPFPGFLRERSFIRPHLVTREGRLVLPYQYYRKQDDEPLCLADGRVVHLPRDPRNGVLISENDGSSWTLCGDVRISDDDAYHGWAEPAVVELRDGRIVMLIRVDGAGCLYRAESVDGGRTWPPFAQPTEIPNPGSKITLYRTATDAVALLHNPSREGRRPLSLWVSFDDLVSWPYQRTLVPDSLDGPGGNLSYPDGFVSRDGRMLHLAFDDNRHRAVYVGASLPPSL